MWSNISRYYRTSILFASLGIFGCSSGGGDSSVAVPVYSGNSLPAAINFASAEEFGRAATDGVNEAVNLTMTGAGIPFTPLAIDARSSSAAIVQKIKEIAIKALQSSTLLDLPAGAVLTFDQLNVETGTNEFCGGSVAIPDDIDPNAALNFTMTFNNLCFDDGTRALTMNGILSFTETNTAFTITFTNFSVNINGNAETFSGTFTCDTALFNCTISTDFADSDGNVFRLEDVDVSGDDLSGYALSANFYHDELGMVSISTTASVTYGNCGSYPHGGAITLNGTTDSSMSVTFNSECTFTLEGFDGSSSFGPDTLSWLIE